MDKIERNKPNALIKEKSPYLLQHAYNPVKWLPWGKEAIDGAKKEDKPIFLSIGYSTCHWCHVMEKESFEDDQVANILKKNFVSIKVDREERPDIDEIYMRAVQRMTGSGGWPLNVFLTPDLRPFYGGTYFPPEPWRGLPSFTQILESINKIWHEKREKIVRDSERINQTLKDKYSTKKSLESISPSIFQEAYESLTLLYDSIGKGFGSAPKFPMSTYLSFLLRYYHREGIGLTLKMVTTSLNAMAFGGIYDQIAGGFHRYSTDRNWMVPHFEKMLYDNALLAYVYLNAYQKTQDSFYSRISKEILDWILDEMMGPKGGFYSAQDADVNGEEGTFYVWEYDEVYEILGKRLGDIVTEYYGVSAVGNFNGKNILFCRKRLAELSPKSIEDFVEAKKILLKVRRKRKKPNLDDKILTSWNALSISSMALGYQVLKEKRFLNAANSSAKLILKELWKENKLYRYFRNGRSQTTGFLEDYAFLVSALIDLFETTFNLEYLKIGLEIHQAMINQFLDEEHGGFYNTEKDSELPARVKTIDDGAIPSGNSIAVSNLIRLSELTGKMEYRKIAEKTITQFTDRLESHPVAYTSMLNSIDLLKSGMKEIVIASKDGREEKKFIGKIWSLYIPNKVVALSRPKNSELQEVIPFTKERIPINGATTVYICENNVCKKPITDLKELKNFLRNQNRTV